MASAAVSEDEKLLLQHGIFPVIPLLVCIAFAALYAHTAHFIVLGPMIPVINALGMAALVIYYLFGVKK